MLEIDVTRYLGDDHDLMDYSSSVAESGQNAAKFTWENALAEANDHPLVTKDEELEYVRRWLLDWGAWDQKEVDAMSDKEVNALLLQFVSGDLREMEMFETPEAYEAAQREGSVSAALGPGDGGRWYYLIG
jgi:hypothetical protein